MKKQIMVSFLLTLLLIHIPIVGDFFRLINTMIHESGHAIISLSLNGEVSHIFLFSNLEGLTTISSNSNFTFFISSIFGYLTTSIFVLLFAYLWYKKLYRVFFIIILILCTINLIFWVRNLYGIVWLIIMIIGFLLILIFLKNKKYLKYITLILFSIIFWDSLLSSIDILILSYLNPEQAGDATNLYKITRIHTLFWGIIFLLQSILFNAIAIKSLLYNMKPSIEENR